jgi:gas vesicle structural protein
MPVARHPGSTSLVDILDRVLDHGIRFTQGPEATQTRPPPSPAERVRIVVEAVETYLEHPQVPPGKQEIGA